MNMNSKQFSLLTWATCCSLLVSLPVMVTAKAMSMSETNEKGGWIYTKNTQ